MKMFVKIDNNTYKCDCGSNILKVYYQEYYETSRSIYGTVYLKRHSTINDGSCIWIEIECSNTWFNLQDYRPSELDKVAIIFNGQITEQLKELYAVDGLKYQQANKDFEQIKM